MAVAIAVVAALVLAASICYARLPRMRGCVIVLEADSGQEILNRPLREKKIRMMMLPRGAGRPVRLMVFGGMRERARIHVICHSREEIKRFSLLPGGRYPLGRYYISYT